MKRLNDPEVVRAEYEDEAGLAARMAVRGTVTFPDREIARAHLAASPIRGHLADSLPFFDGPLVASRHVAVFVCEP